MGDHPGKLLRELPGTKSCGSRPNADNIVLRRSRSGPISQDGPVPQSLAKLLNNSNMTFVGPISLYVPPQAHRLHFDCDACSRIL
ncbi:hypothetical protein L3X38_006819 [Prunus dulcis]|uniref:Uncharacterized protein n=1 Tax=Prunus dulcis TaxID=3755 RepID=A0AAD4ZTI4_PRUDU|nr:hypothetical protein L3X38_006819 [Prunus dulcis]